MDRYRLIALFLCLVMVLGGCRQPGDEPPQTLPTEPVQATEATQETTEATEPVTEATQEATEVTEGPQWGPEIHSGLRSDGTFNSGTLFIGDSLTYGLVNEYLDRYGFLGEARYMAIVGVPVGVFFNQGITLGNHGSSLYSPEFRGMSYCDAVASVGSELTAIYIMLGTNYTHDTTQERYMEIVDYLLETCPNATIHLQLIPYTTNSLVQFENVNEHIRATCRYYQDQGIQRVMCIDTHTAINMYLVGDGVHLSGEGKDAWYMALVSHSINNQLPE